MLQVPRTGAATQDIPIPSNPALVGLTLYGQGLLLGGNRPAVLTNPIRETIEAR